MALEDLISQSISATFKQSFCRHCSCLPENYTREVFVRCVVSKHRFLVKLAWWFEYEVVFESKKLIEEIAGIQRIDNLTDAITDYSFTLQELGLAGSSFRLSGECLTELFQTVQKDSRGK